MKKKLLILAALFTFIPLNVKAQTLANYVTGLVGNDSSVVADDPDHNPRYIGANPNNYVEFNGELWRIIGVFDGRVKLIRKDYVINLIMFDRTASNINSGYGVNYWATSIIQRELNGDYLNANLDADTIWEADKTFDHTRVLKRDAQDMIDDAVWHQSMINLDENNNGLTLSTMTAAQAYANERSNVIPVFNTTKSTANDGTVREPTWTGKVGLMYMSDYLYSTSGNDATPRETCIGKISWSGSNCYKNTWMPYYNAWTITPSYNADRAIYMCATSMYGIGCSALPSSYAGNTLYPVVYLKPSISFNDGTGTSDDPFRISNPKVVTFNTNDGSNVDNQYVLPNRKASKPSDPTKEDNIFKGWYTDPELTNEFDFDSEITGDITLYAKWQFDYKILEGKDQTFADKDLTIKTNGDLTKLEKIKVNDKVVDEKNYELKKGSTILTLKADYLKALENANYTITFEYSDGSVSTTFKINQETKLAANTTEDTTTKEETKTTNPKTGDNVMKFIILLGVSIVGFIVIIIVALKKKTKK